MRYNGSGRIMKNNFLFWLPRILGILFAVFISIFALDAFGEGIPVLEAIIGFVIHLVPTLAEFSSSSPVLSI